VLKVAENETTGCLETDCVDKYSCLYLPWCCYYTALEFRNSYKQYISKHLTSWKKHNFPGIFKPSRISGLFFLQTIAMVSGVTSSFLIGLSDPDVGALGSPELSVIASQSTCHSIPENVNFY
jgi:hypothetical protein